MATQLWPYEHPGETSVRKSVVDELVRETLATLSPAGFQAMIQSAKQLLGELSGVYPSQRLHAYLSHPPDDLGWNWPTLRWGLGAIPDAAHTALAAAPLAAGAGALAQRSGSIMLGGTEYGMGQAGLIRGATQKQRQTIQNMRRHIRRNVPASPKYSDPSKQAFSDLLNYGVPHHGSGTGLYPYSGETYGSLLARTHPKPRLIPGKLGEPRGISLGYSQDIYGEAGGMFVGKWPPEYEAMLQRKLQKIEGKLRWMGQHEKFYAANMRYMDKYGHLEEAARPSFYEFLQQIEPKFARIFNALGEAHQQTKYQMIYPPSSRSMVIFKDGVLREEQIIDEITPQGKEMMREAYRKAMQWAHGQEDIRQTVMSVFGQNITIGDMGLVPPHRAMINAWEVGLLESGNMRKFNDILTLDLERRGQIGILFHPHRGWKYMKEWEKLGKPDPIKPGLTTLQHGERELKIFDSNRVMHIDLRDWNDAAIDRMWNKQLFEDVEILQKAGIPEKAYRRAGSGRTVRLHEARESLIDSAMDPSMAGNYAQIDLEKETIEGFRKYWTQSDQKEFERILGKRIFVRE